MVGQTTRADQPVAEIVSNTQPSASAPVDQAAAPARCLAEARAG
jgi:hypothetical protein